MEGSPGGAESFDALARELGAVFARGVDAALPEERFEELALRAFGHQFASNPTYRRFAEGRGRTPDRVGGWRDVPAVPTDAFKRLKLVSGEPEEVERVFRTSGTTAGPGRRGVHHVRRVALYHASLLPNFRAHLVPEGGRLPFLSLVPRPERLPDSSLSEMVGVAMAELGAPGSGWFVDPDRGIDEGGLWRGLRERTDADEPVLVVSTAFALVHWMDTMDREGWRIVLPPGSRIMETGGFKGRSRTLPREELYGAVADRMGVPAGRIVNEYGMTELLSQFYEPVLREGRGNPGEPDEALPDLASRRHVPPPWVRTRVLDPHTLEELSPGGEGILCHFDLANLGSVSAILTADRGVASPDGFQVLGRTPGAEPRGCSLAMDELLGGANG